MVCVPKSGRSDLPCNVAEFERPLPWTGENGNPVCTAIMLLTHQPLVNFETKPFEAMPGKW